MKRTLFMGAGLLALAASLGSIVPGRSAAQEADGPRRDTHVKPQTRLVPQRQWEYLQLQCMPVMGSEREREDRLNEQGKLGWELVSLVEVEQPPGRGCLLATFKRPVLN